MASLSNGHIIDPSSNLIDLSEFPLGEFLPSDVLEDILSQQDHTDTHISAGKCVAVKWREPNMNRILQRLLPNISEKSTPQPFDLILQIILDDPVEEIRLEWTVTGGAQTLSLPGMDISAPDQSRFSLLLSAGDGPLTRARLFLTMSTPSDLIASSDFAWKRADDREVHPDEDRDPDADPFFQLTLQLIEDGFPPEGLTVALASFDLTKAKLPTFMQQFEEPLQAIDIEDPTSLCQPVNLETKSLELDQQYLQLILTVGTGFTLPFLKQADDGNGFGQFIRINDSGTITLDKETRKFAIPLTIQLNFGSIDLTTQSIVHFDWEIFSLDISHEQGIDLFSQLAVNGGDFLGLHWTFKGKEVSEEGHPGRYHLLTLATKDYNYQVQQAQGAIFEVGYDGLSDAPIRFSITDFALTEKGLNITTKVIDQPVNLNGLDTKFRFHDSGFQIVENRIQAFTLAGTGPMPPALVGQATAHIYLQFGRLSGGNLTLVEGKAELKGEKLLHCKGTRFQFSIDALGLRFVNDGKFHLYFTLTGSAQFILAPGDDTEGALALLPKIKIDLVECPLTGDASVIGQHIEFLIELPKPISFSFLGCFEMELRAIGFVPQAEAFDGDGAMEITGQLKFAAGPGDAPDPRHDFHRLLIGLPEKGSFIPRIYFKQIAVNINMGAAFSLNGVVEFHDSLQEKGFSGEGVLEIHGMPPLAASFAFLRVRENETSPWLRAWFIYLEIRRVSFVIPVVQIYLREIGLGFGYRFTLVSIKAADAANDVKQLLAELQELSRTQGDLSKRDRWAVDLEKPGQSVPWTIVLRAMIAQTSAAPSPLTWLPYKEEKLACLYLFDAVIAFRSDFTFFMAVRGWLNTNYHDFDSDNQGLRSKPLVSGFVLLSPRQKRFLAHLASNPDGEVGPHPPLPEFVKSAIASARFSATLLVEPGLLHYELGWPNMLRWEGRLGPLQVDFRGGFIFRLSRSEFVTGVSYLARGSLRVGAGFDAGLFGVSLTAVAQVAYGARYIGVLAFENLKDSAFYGGLGLELYIEVTIRFWIRFIFFTKSWRFSIGIGFTASLEIGILGDAAPGLRGTGTVSLRAMGRSLRFNVDVGINKGAVHTARQRTEKFMDIGLEATEVDSLPGVDATFAAGGALIDAAAMPPRGLAATVDQPPPSFQMPGYNLFVVTSRSDNGHENDAADPFIYFVLYPQGERKNGDVAVEEPGFYPVPPTDLSESGNDMVLTVPATGSAYTLERFDPNSDNWESRPIPETDEPETDKASFKWRAHWEAVILKGESYEEKTDKSSVPNPDAEPDPAVFTLADTLRTAFLLENDKPVSDPNPLMASERLEDERVHNPTDNAFEAAVRGAVEQFQGSPFFKRDPNYTYDRLLGDSFRDDTSIYAAGGVIDGGIEAAHQAHMQADQMRSVIIQDVLADVRQYAETADDSLIESSTPFQLGVVFRVRKSQRPPWLEDLLPHEGLVPKVNQRLGHDQIEQGSNGLPVRTFNISATNFANNPPQFQRVRHYSDASMIAITWDLAWEQAPSDRCTNCQKDPEHHLLHYRVQRRPLDSQERGRVFTVKPGEVLSREANGDGGDLLRSLKPRFQVVDHFTQETAEERAALPATGRSYLYTITPFDFAGNAGRPLTIVATRFPNDPPQVPVDAELTVGYRVSRQDVLPPQGETVELPPLLPPHRITVTWSDPPTPTTGPKIGIDQVRLIFRREATLPIGSYGLDSTTQRSGSKSLPSSNARPQPTDIKITLEPTGQPMTRTADIPLATLQATGVFPTDQEGLWQPDAWRVFIQTSSISGVPSALAPVQLLLRVEAKPQGEVVGLLDQREERRPAELEWLPSPIRLPLLPAEDQQAKSGPAHVPMPLSEPFKFTSDLDVDTGYKLHPAGIRTIRFRWNQGPSHLANYPLDLNAGYHLLELDIDAYTEATFNDAEKLASVLRTIQEVQMLPADDLLLEPGDTLTTNQWEAWYPSTIRRLVDPAARAEGSEIGYTPWYSWRDSLLIWPEWPGFSTPPFNARQEALHPFLQSLVEKLQGDDEEGGDFDFIVDLQTSPPMQPMTLEDLMNNTAPDVDPYGWGILQRFGLSVTLSLRDPNSGELVSGQELIDTLKDALDALKSQPLIYSDIAPHLHVELLFQPGQRVSLAEEPLSAAALLGIVQVSLRPVVKQQFNYAQRSVTGPPGGKVMLEFTLDEGDSCTVIIQSDATGTQFELEPSGEGEETVFQTITLPMSGQTTLLMRSANIREVNLPEQDTEPIELGSEETFTPRDERSSYFTVPVDTWLSQLDSEADFNLDGEGLAFRQWQAFKQYAESLNSTDNPETVIKVPTDQTGIDEILTGYLAWTQRFFNRGGDVSALGSTGEGPWLATAYPRVTSPAYTTPDENGRLKYDHLLGDKWAHTFRYYLRPYGRYDLLWRSFRQSPLLFPEDKPLLAVPVNAQPDPQAGGLDVVLDRTRPVARPVILRSGRLDGPTIPGSPNRPGSTWEVIVAQHSEQALSERNQTLARRLSYRHIAFTLQRRFSFTGWLEMLRAIREDDHPLVLEPVASNVGEIDIPGPYSPPDYLDLNAPALPDGDVVALDLPNRMPRFQAGALVLQWQGLPFYYEHRLLLVAQTTSNVSPTNRISQQDFEYRSPPCSASVDGVLQKEDDNRGRCLTIPLQRFWDSLPPEAKFQWPDEDPDVAEQDSWLPGSLPDPGVVYQVIAYAQGSLEVQAELHVNDDLDFDNPPPKDLTTGNIYVVRQLSQKFIINQETPQLSFDDVQKSHLLTFTLDQVSEIPLSRDYSTVSVTDLTDTTERKVVAIRDNLLFFRGVMTAQDIASLQTVLQIDPGSEDADILQRFSESWYCQGPVSKALPADSLPVTSLDFPLPNHCDLVWHGTMNKTEADALKNLPGDRQFKDALEELIQAIDPDLASVSPAETVTVRTVLGPKQMPPSAVAIGLSLEMAPDDFQLNWLGITNGAKLALHLGSRKRLHWTGRLYDDEKARIEPVLRDWAQVTVLSTALTDLFTKMDGQIFTFPYPPRPAQADLPAGLRIEEGALRWEGNLPTPEMFKDLAALQGDVDFETAVSQLIDQLNADVSVDLDDFTQEPDPASLPDLLQDRLVMDGDFQKLVWIGPTPTSDELAALNQLLTTITDSYYPKYLQALLDQIAQSKKVELLPLNRPLPENVNPILPLTVERDRLVWAGRLRNEATLNALNALIDASWEQHFLDALIALRTALIGQSIEVNFDLALRPEQDQLDDLKEKLLIGRHIIRFHGLMAYEEGMKIKNAYTCYPDQQVIRKLYDCSLSKGLGDVELRVRSRRGSATPAGMSPLQKKSL